MKTCEVFHVEHCVITVIYVHYYVYDRCKWYSLIGLAVIACGDGRLDRTTVSRFCRRRLKLRRFRERPRLPASRCREPESVRLRRGHGRLEPFRRLRTCLRLPAVGLDWSPKSGAILFWMCRKY